MYSSFARVLLTERTFEGIAPLLFVRNDVAPMLCSEGLFPALYLPDARRSSMAGLYFFKTLRLSAFGLAVGDIHQMCV